LRIFGEEAFDAIGILIAPSSYVPVNPAHHLIAIHRSNAA
jgi:hypothetical protein